MIIIDQTEPNTDGSMNIPKDTRSRHKGVTQRGYLPLQTLCDASLRERNADEERSNQRRHTARIQRSLQSWQ